MSRYTAHVTRDEIDRHTQARHLREIDTMARDLVAVMTDETPESIDLDIHVENA